MNGLRILKKYRLASLLPVAVFSLLSKLCGILKTLWGSDVMITGSGSFIKYLPKAAGYCTVAFSLAATACCIASVIYADMYFSRRTSLRTSFISLGAAAFASALSCVFDILYNSYEMTSSLALVLTAVVDLAYIAAAAFGSLVISVVLKALRPKGFSPALPVILSSVLYYIARICDLTFSNVLPFLRAYDDVSKDEILTIAGDYIYFTLLYLLVLCALSLLFCAVLRKITGRLKFKVIKVRAESSVT